MAVNLYKVTVGPNVWKYTSGEFDVQTATELWKAIPLKRKDLTYDLKNTDLTLTVSSDTPPFDTYKYNTPIVPIEVVVYDYPSMSAKFTGVVVGISYNVTKNVATVKLGSTDAIGNSTCPNRTYGQMCSFTLFDSMCAVPASSFTATIPAGELNWVSGNIFKHPAIAGYPDGSFRNGYILFDTGESQFITNHTGDTITLLGAVFTKDTASSVDVTYGCNKSKNDCESKFNNLPNFGGFPFIPTKNPVTEGY